MADCKDPTMTFTEIPLNCAHTSSVPAKKSVFANFTYLLSIHNATTKVLTFIQEWTPFLLVLSYFIFSICLYMVCTEKLVAVFWFIYMTTNFYIAGTTVLEAFVSISPCRDARKAVSKLQENDWVFPTPDDELLVLDLIIVAYLPNEKDIIMDRAHYALENIVYPRDKIRINIVYNTPRP